MPRRGLRTPTNPRCEGGALGARVRAVVVADAASARAGREPTKARQLAADPAADPVADALGGRPGGTHGHPPIAARRPGRAPEEVA